MYMYNMNMCMHLHVHHVHCTCTAWTCMHVYNVHVYMHVCLYCISIANPIDVLAKYVNITEEDVDIEMQEPYHLLRVSYTCTCTIMYS